MTNKKNAVWTYIQFFIDLGGFSLLRMGSTVDRSNSWARVDGSGNDEVYFYLK